jgi:hypothetical protein
MVLWNPDDSSLPVNPGRTEMSNLTRPKTEPTSDQDDSARLVPTLWIIDVTSAFQEQFEFTFTKRLLSCGCYIKTKAIGQSF